MNGNLKLAIEHMEAARKELNLYMKGKKYLNEEIPWRISNARTALLHATVYIEREDKATEKETYE